MAQLKGHCTDSNISSCPAELTEHIRNSDGKALIIWSNQSGVLVQLQLHLDL